MPPESIGIEVLKNLSEEEYGILRELHGLLY